MRIAYRSLNHYKYQLMHSYEMKVDIYPVLRIETPFMCLSTEGSLLIKKGYCWDGASGPAWDSKNIMRGSLVHDAIYQLMRMDLIGMCYRPCADELLKSICLQDGMSKFRAWYVYNAVKYFAAYAAKPK